MQNRTATTEESVSVHAQRAKFMHGPHPKFLSQMPTVKSKIHFVIFFGKPMCPSHVPRCDIGCGGSFPPSRVLDQRNARGRSQGKWDGKNQESTPLDTCLCIN